MGHQLHKYENLLNREFQADKPNRKWVTDISHIHTGQGVLYLSVIRDLFENSIVAYKTGTSQSVNLVQDTIRLAMQKEKKVAAELQLHSDQGSQYILTVSVTRRFETAYSFSQTTIPSFQLLPVFKRSSIADKQQSWFQCSGCKILNHKG